METIINAWGGEGFLSAAAVILVACMGMLRNTDKEIHLRVLDFAVGSKDDIRRKNLQEAFGKYYEILFGEKSKLVFDDISMNDITNFEFTKSLVQKYNNPDILSLGCSEVDMNLSIVNGIYGKPWLGEVYHSDANFSKLYEKISSQEQVIIINCGGYRGGGTAATFIPLETMYQPAHLIVKRFSVIAGPSTEFCHMVNLPYPEIYSRYSENEIRQVNIFDIENMMGAIQMFTDYFNQNQLNDETEKNAENIRKLEESFDMVRSEHHDFTNLNPKNYIPRFFDRVFSDNSSTAATFINIKTDGETVLKYDIVSDEFEPDTQFHKMNIISLINAVSIMEIIRNHSRYDNGKVYSFGNPYGNKFTPNVIFTKECSSMYWQFIIMAVVSANHVYSCFSAPFLKEHLVISKKWAKTNIFKKIENDISKPNGKYNIEFANDIRQNLISFINGYIYPVFKVLEEIESTSEQADMFGNNHEFISGVCSFVDFNNKMMHSSDGLEDYVACTITDIVQYASGKERISIRQDVEYFLRKFDEQFPEYENNILADTYFKKIIKYTMKAVSEFNFV